MKYRNPELEMEQLEAIDVIATSPEQEETTVSPIEPSIKNDPYENDKW